MLNQPEVKVTVIKSIKQFGKDLFLKRSGQKYSLRMRRLGYCSLFLFFVLLTVLTFMDHRKNKTQVRTIELPTTSKIKQSDQSYPVPEYEKTKADHLTISESHHTKSRGNSKGVIPPSHDSGIEWIPRVTWSDLKVGSEFKAKLIKGASDGPVQAQVIENVIVDGSVIIPKNSILLGSASSAEDRLLIEFKKIQLNGGGQKPFKGQGYDATDSFLGIKADKMNRFIGKVATGVALGFVGGMAEGLKETQVQNGLIYKAGNLNNALLNGVSVTALEQSKKTLESSDQKETRVLVNAETLITVIVTE